MGLLDSILGGVLGDAMGQPAPRQAQPGAGGNSALMALLPIVLGMLMNRQGGQAAASGGGGLSDVLGGMLGGRGTQSGGGLGDILGGMLGGGAGNAGGMGGLGGLLEQFQRAGYAEQANSWVSTSQNQPIPPDAIAQVFGNDTLTQIARQAGISEAQASQGLSQLLPEVVDRVTPNGTVPDLDQLAASVDSLLRQRGVG